MNAPPMGRRAFLLSGLALAPGISAAQPAAIRRVGYLSTGRPPTRLAAALAALGWTEGRTLHLMVRTSEGPEASLDARARELVAERPEVVVAVLREAVTAIRRASPSVAIVAAVHDPVLDGFAQSLARPGGRVTGLTFSSPDSVKMSFRLIGEVMPGLRRIHAIAEGGFHRVATVVSVRREIAAERGIEFVEHDVRTTAEAARVVERVRNRREEAIVVGQGLARDFDFPELAAHVLRARVATIDTTGRMEGGFLLAAGLRHADMWGRLASIVDQVLRGADPATIPFEQPMHSYVVLNRRTAAAIGVRFPETVLLRATQVID